MALERMGIHKPEGIKTECKHAFHDDGMHYELWSDEEDFYVAADHEDVGLITWYRATAEDWSDLENEADEIIG